MAVTIVAGLPGAGKTSVIRSVVQTTSVAGPVAVLTPFPSSLSDLPESKAKIFPISDAQLEWDNGEMRILLSQDLLIEIGRLARQGGYRHALVEWNGTLDLMQSVDTFTFDLDGQNHRLADLAHIDCLVSVLEVPTLLRNFRESRELQTLGIARGKYDERTLTDLLVEQIEWSHVIVLNKCDTAGHSQILTAGELVSALNPSAACVQTSHGAINLEVLGTGLCRIEEVGRFYSWLPTPRVFGSAPGQYHDMTVIYFEADKPFHPERLHRALDPYWDRVVRSKGLLWLATKHDFAGVWSQAGDVIDMDWTSWENPDSELDSTPLSTHDTPPGELGDPRQQLLFVGTRLPKETILAGLHRALLTDEELKLPRSVWERFPDPFSFDAQVND